MGKEQFLAMTCIERRAWARKYRIPFRGGRREKETLEILAKICVKWQVD